MDTLKTPPKPPNPSMNKNFTTKLRLFNYAKAHSFSTCPIETTNTHTLIPATTSKTRALGGSFRVSVKASDAQMKQNWLDSITCPGVDKDSVRASNGDGLDWVIGIDPDVSGAFALLKTDHSGWSAQVFDNPYVQVLVGKRVRKRLDANAIVQRLKSFGAPHGTTAYIEQSIPFPQDGKQGWWGGGFVYGMWIGILVASGFTVVPVPSLLWKNHFELAGTRYSKDDSRKAAGTLFPSLSSLLTRKKDHGRAEALLIAAYGKGLKIKSDAVLEIKSDLCQMKPDADAALEIKSDLCQITSDAAVGVKSDLCQITSDAAVGVKSDLCTALT